MKKLSHFFVALLFVFSMMLFACDGQQSNNRDDQGRAPGMQEDGIYQDDQGIQDTESEYPQDETQMEQDTVGQDVMEPGLNETY